MYVPVFANCDYYLASKSVKNGYSIADPVPASGIGGCIIRRYDCHRSHMYVIEDYDMGI